jgi:sigma-B regulation protein RsbU (phosphoserine phosphatase)
MAAPRVNENHTWKSDDAFSDHLELLAAMGHHFAASRDIDKTLEHALVRITEYLDAESGALFMLDDEGKTLTCTSCYGATQITGFRLPSDQGIVGRAVQNNAGEIVRDVSTDPNFFPGVDRRTGYTTKSILCAPISIHDRRMGAIELINKKGSDPRFTADDLHMLETMASSAGLAILNARMSEALVEKERFERELELAAEIQRSLLPERRDDGFPIQGASIPARLVSGDFYDFFTLPDGRISFNLGDVSGKGMNAALLMAKTASLYRCLGKTLHHPGELLARINAEIHETATRGMFVTMIGGIYDPATGRVRLANAGHEPPLLHRRDGGFVAFPADAPPLGILSPSESSDAFPETELNLDGGTLYVFTDGVTEGYLKGGGTLGVEGFEAAIREHAKVPLARRLDSVTGLFGGAGGTLRDDVTMLGVDDAAPAKARSAVSGSPPPPAKEAAKESAKEEELVRLEVSARPDRLKLVRRAVSEAVALCGCGETLARDLVIGVDEACQNVIRHAYGGDPEGEMIVEIRRKGDELIILLRDFAPPVDVDKIRPRDLDDLRPGGLGTHLIDQVMDEVAFLPPPPGGGNLLRMVKRIS